MEKIDLAQKFTDLVVDKKLSQPEVAILLGVHRPQVSNIMRKSNLNKISVERLMRFIEILASQPGRAAMAKGQHLPQRNLNFLPFQEAREIVRSLGLQSKPAWETWLRTKRITGVPSAPNTVYSTEWINWGDWLGTNRIADKIKHRDFLTYEDCKAFLAQYKFNSETEFYAWAKSEARPANVPASPRKTYLQEGWIDMGDFLGTGNIAPRNYNLVTFAEARAFAQEMGLFSDTEWREWAKSEMRPIDIPADPFYVYAKEWRGWADFLGYQRKSSYGEKIISHFLSGNQLEFQVHGTLPGCKYIRPLHFDFVLYLQERPLAVIEFQGVQHFQNVAFFNSRHTHLTDQIKATYCRDNEIPLFTLTYLEIDDIEAKLITFLESIYENKILRSFPRTLLANTLKWRDFEEIREFARNQQLKNPTAWRNYVSAHRPIGCPINPDRTYKDCGWTSWEDFLNIPVARTIMRGRNFVNFEECRTWIKDKGVQNYQHWKRIRATRPSNIPSHPDYTYRDQGWRGWRHFLSDEP